MSDKSERGQRYEKKREEFRCCEEPDTDVRRRQSKINYYNLLTRE